MNLRGDARAFVQVRLAIARALVERREHDGEDRDRRAAGDDEDQAGSRVGQVPDEDEHGGNPAEDEQEPQEELSHLAER